LFGILPGFSGGFLLLFRVTVIGLCQMNLPKNDLNQAITRYFAV
jgi:hypothetical protein